MQKHYSSLLSMGLFFLLSVAPGVAQTNPPQIVPNLYAESGITLAPGVDFAQFTPTIGGNAISVAALTLTGNGSNVLNTSSFDLFNNNGIATVANSLSFFGVNNSSSISIRSGLGNSILDPNIAFGSMSFPQTLPAMNPNPTPSGIGGLTPAIGGYQIPSSQVTGPSLAVARPDFEYISPKLEFAKVLGSSRTGQKGMDVAPGTPTGVRRFVPVGEF